MIKDLLNVFHYILSVDRLYSFIVRMFYHIYVFILIYINKENVNTSKYKHTVFLLLFVAGTMFETEIKTEKTKLISVLIDYLQSKMSLIDIV